jgi:hypothetical protein
MMTEFRDFVQERISAAQAAVYKTERYQEEKRVYDAALSRLKMRLGKDFAKAFLPVDNAATALECTSFLEIYLQGIRDAIALKSFFATTDKPLSQVLEEMIAYPGEEEAE